MPSTTTLSPSPKRAEAAAINLSDESREKLIKPSEETRANKDDKQIEALAAPAIQPKSTQEKKDSEKNETKDFLQKSMGKLYELSNYGQLAGNMFSFISKVISPLEKFKGFADKVGELSTKAFLFVHGVLNTGTQLMKKNYSSALGYMVYIVNSIFLPQNKTYLMNGFAVGLTQLNNQANNLDKDRKINGFMDHLDHIKNALKKTYQNWTQDPWRNLKKEDNAMVGMVGAMGSLGGAILGAATGSQQAGALVRDPSGLSLDLEQVLPYQWAKKRFCYIGSGIAYIAGTVFDFLSKFSSDHEEILRPLCFSFDGIGRYLQSLAERRGELNDKHLEKEKANDIIYPVFKQPEMALAA